ncbi:MAG: hypothetical protein HUU60_07740 [Armatimonadetes bacterium]|nr:hypothetical protein [Armatimonadota bacterium]
MNTVDKAQYGAWRRNLALLLGEVVFFFVGLAFIDLSTVLPVFVKKLVKSDEIVGLILGLRAVMLLLPQFLMPHLLAHRAFAKPLLLALGAIGRLSILGYGLYMYNFGGRNPHIDLAFFIAAFLLFMLMDGAVWAPWTAIVERSLPPEPRAWFFGAIVTITALASLLPALVVDRLLSKGADSQTYGILFLCFAGAGFVSWLCILGIREQPRTGIYDEPLRFRSYLIELADTFRTDVPFRKLFLGLACMNAFGIASTFYVLDAESIWKSDSWVGKYLIASQVGGAVAGLLWIGIRRQWGARTALLCLGAVALLAPATAIATRLVSPWAFTAPFVLQGMIGVGAWSLAMGYMIENFPSDPRQVIRIGALNALTAISAGLPILGGALKDRFGSIPMYAVATVICLIGLVTMARATTVPRTAPVRTPTADQTS